MAVWTQDFEDSIIAQLNGGADPAELANWYRTNIGEVAGNHASQIISAWGAEHQNDNAENAKPEVKRERKGLRTRLEEAFRKREKPDRKKELAERTKKENSKNENEKPKQNKNQANTKNYLGDIDKKIIVEDKNRVAFVKTEDGKEVKNPRNAYGEKKENDKGKKTAGMLDEGSYFAREDIDKAIENLIKQNKRGEIELGSGEVIKLKKALFRKKISKGSLKKLNEALAKEAAITLPSEKEIKDSSKGGGWFGFQADNMQSGDHSEFKGKTQLGEANREDFVSANDPTQYIRINAVRGAEKKKFGLTDKQKANIKKWAPLAVGLGVTLATGLIGGVGIPMLAGKMIMRAVPSVLTAYGAKWLNVYNANSVKGPDGSFISEVKDNPVQDLAETEAARIRGQYGDGLKEYGGIKNFNPDNGMTTTGHGDNLTAGADGMTDATADNIISNFEFLEKAADVMNFVGKGIAVAGAVYGIYKIGKTIHNIHQAKKAAKAAESSGPDMDRE